MKTAIFASILLLLVHAAYTQPCDGIPNGVYEIVYWESGDPENQKRYWNDGSLKVESERINDSLILRREYYDNGNLKLTCEMRQVWLEDTVYQKSPITGKDTMIFVEGYKDFPNGMYTYFSKRRPNQRIYWGRLKDRTKVGKWKKLKYGYYLLIVNFDEEGYLTGPYYSLHFNYHTKKVSNDTFWVGQYHIFHDTITRISPLDMKTEYNVVEKESRKVGKWHRYNSDGKLIQTVEYKWYDD